MRRDHKPGVFSLSYEHFGERKGSKVKEGVPLRKWFGSVSGRSFPVAFVAVDLR